MRATGFAVAAQAYSGRMVVYDDLHLGSPRSALDGLAGYDIGGAHSVQYGEMNNLYGCGAFRFRAACKAILLVGDRGGAATWSLAVDGILLPPFVAPAGSGRGPIGTVTGLDPAAVREYEVICDDTTAYHHLDTVALIGGTGFDATVPAARPVVAGLGDSITAGAATTPTGGYVARFARARASACVNAGVSSSTMAGVTSPMHSRTATVTQFGAAVTDIVLCGGINDIIQGVTAGDYRTAYDATIASLLAGCTAANLWCLGILPNDYDDAVTPLVPTFNAQASAAVTAAASGRAAYVDPSPWSAELSNGGNWTTYFAPDKLHPNAAGHALIHSLLEAAIA